MMARFIPLGLFAALSLLSCGAGRAEPAPSASASELQAYAFDLVNVGEFDRAEAVFEQLAGMRGERLAMTAWFHWGNLLETYRTMDAASITEVRKTLTEAREAHDRALAGLKDARGPKMPHLRPRLESHLEAIDANLARLDQIERGEVPLTLAGELVDDMNAPAAAAALLQSGIDAGDPSAETLTFLSLVYRIAYLDHLYLRLGNMEEARAHPERPLVGEAAWKSALAVLEEAAKQSGDQVDQALRQYEGSPHWLDFLTFAADVHRYSGMLYLMRAKDAESDSDLASADADGVESELEARALLELERMIQRTREVVAFSEGALADRSMLSPRQARAYPARKLEIYRELADRGLRESAAIME